MRCRDMPGILKRVYYLLLLSASNLFAMPQGEKVAAGQADFASSDGILQITVSDKAIINYQSFSINEAEHVQFIQPTTKSSVLNRVTSQDPSQILGHLSGNGRVFLINPNGICFGPKAVINTGSFLASTLNILNEDFLNDNFRFFQESGSEKASIVNDGMISSSPEGFVALFAPMVENRGTIYARAGKVVLAAAEKVTLDFSGDGLIQFAVDGELKQALIENFGHIDAANGTVELSLHTAKDAIKMVVNTDGIAPANSIEEVNGVIHLVSQSCIRAKKVILDGGDHSRVEVEGAIDASTSGAGEKGGVVHVLGDRVRLKGAKIHASGNAGGGEVLVGGGYQGKESVHNAKTTWMDAKSTINADAWETGDGGRVIVWSDHTTLFDGNISVKGGVNKGNGGFVETSGKLNLGVNTGKVDTSAPNGEYGKWLLDPSNVIIQTGGGALLIDVTAPNCATSGSFTINPSTFESVGGTVAICAQNAANSSITVNSNIALSGTSLQLTAGSANAGPITVNNPITSDTGGGSVTLVGTIALNNSIETVAGAITLTGAVTLGATVTLDTTGSGEPGAAIAINGTIDGAYDLTVNTAYHASGNTATFAGVIGGTTPLSSLTVTATAISINNIGAASAGVTGATQLTGVNGNITLTGTTYNAGSQTYTTDVFINPSSGITTITSNNNNLTFQTIISGLSNTIQVPASSTFTANAGSGTITVGNITGASATSSLVNLTNSGAGVTIIQGRITTIETLTFSADGGAIQLQNTISITPHTGVSFPLGRAVVLSNTPATTATSVTISPASGSSVAFGSTIDADVTTHTRSLTVTTLGAGTVTFTGAVGSITPLSSLTANSASTITQSSTVQTIGLVNYTGSGGITLDGYITTSGGTVTMYNPVTLGGAVQIDTTNGGNTSAGAGINFSGSTATINGGFALSLISGTNGTISLGGAVGVNTPLSSLSVNSGTTVTQSSSAKTTGFVSYTGNHIILTGNITTTTAPSGTVTMTGPVTLNASTVKIDTTNNGASSGASISFNGTINNNSSTQRNLTLQAGTAGTISFAGNVGTPTNVLASISINSAQLAQITNSSLYVHSGVTISCPLQLTGTDSINSDLTYTGSILFESTVDGPGSLTVGGHSNAIDFEGVVGGTTPLASFTVGSCVVCLIGGNITTNSSAGISLELAPAFLANSLTLDTTASGTFSAGGAITFSTLDGAVDLTLAGGTEGAIVFESDVGDSEPLTNLIFNSANQIQIGGNITMSGDHALIFPTPVIVTDSYGGLSPFTITSFSSPNTGANITFSSTINGYDGTEDLELSAGTGSILFSGVVGGPQPLDSVTISSAGTITVNASITTDGLGAEPGVISFTGTNIAINADLTTLTGSTGPVSFTHSGTLTIASGVTIAADGAFSDIPAAGSPTTLLFGNVTTNGQNITFGSPVTLGSSSVSISTGTNPLATGNIQFSSTVDGTSAGAQSLSLNTENGNVIFTLAAGASKRLGTLTVTNTSNFTANAMTLAAFDQVAGSGTTTFNGAVDINTSAGMQISNSRTVFNSTVNTTNGGVVNIAVGNLLTLSSSAAFTLTGAFTESGSMHLAGSIATASQPIQLGGSVVLTGPTTLSTIYNSTSGANIHFESTLDGTGALALSAGTAGNINFDQSVGYATRLGGLTINSAAAITASAGIRASWIDQVQAAASTYNGDSINNNAIDTNALIPSTSSEAVLSGTAISISGNLFTRAGGAFIITNSGQLTLAAGSSTSLSGVFLQQGGGNVTLSGLISTTVITTNPAIYFTNPITLSGDATLTSPGSGTGSITLSSTVDGTTANTESLTLSNNSGNIYLNGDVGDYFPLLSLTISQAASVTTQAITASSITQSNGSGATAFNGPVACGSGISLYGTAFTFNNNVTTTPSGALSVTGALTFNSSAVTPSYQIGGAFTQSGGAVSLTGPLSAGGAIQIHGALTVPALESGSLDTSALNQPITLYSTVDGPGSLTLGSGTGDIQINGIVGSTSLNSLTIATVRNFTAEMAVHAAALTQTSGTGLTKFEGNVTADSGGMNFTGVNFTFLESVTTHSGGAITIDHSGTLTTTAGMTISSDGIFTQTGSGTAANVQLGSTIQTTNATAANAAINFTGSPITLTAPVDIDSHTGGGTITFSANSSVDSSAMNHQPITLNAGGGDIYIDSVFGATALGAFTITNAYDVTVQAISADSIKQSAAVVGGTTSLLGSLTTDTSAGIQITGYNFIVGPDVTSITTTNGGSLIVNNSGLITGTVSTFPSPTITVSGSFSQIGSGTIVVAGLVTAYLGISFTGPVIVFEDTTLDSSAGSGGISFTNTVDSCSGTLCPGPQNLTLIAGSGDISFSDSVGGTDPLGVLTFQSAANINALNSLSTISTASITTNALTPLTGLAHFECAITTSSSAGIVLKGNQFTFNNDITTTGLGSVTITNTGTLTIGNLADFMIDGYFQQNGAGAVFFDGTITTTNANPTIDAISFASPVTLITPAIFDTTGGSGDNNITFAGTVDGASTLTMTAGSGDITFDSTIGLPTQLTGLTVNSAATVLLSGTASLSGPVLITAGSMTFGGSLSASAITLDGAAIAFDNSVATSSGNISITNSGLLTTASGISSGGIFTQTGAGAVNLAGTIQTMSTTSANAGIHFSGTGAITLTGPVLIDSHIGGGTIIFEHSPTSGSSTVDGYQPITLNAGAGDINIYSVFGGITALGAVTFTMAHNITVQAITADSITQSGATASGTSSLLGNLIANTGSGISLTGANFSSSGSITTIPGSNGALTIKNSGTVSGTGASTITLDGAFTQTAVGTNSLVDLGGTITLTSPAAVSFTSPVNVLLPTTITSDNGNMTFYNRVDGPACLTLAAGSGNVTFDGIVGGTTPLGCLIISSANTILQNSSLATSGYVHETATMIQLYGNVTTNEAASILTNEITLTGNVAIGAAVTLSNNGGAGDISISGTTDSYSGNNNLVIEANSGNITLSQPIGATTSFNNLTFSGNTISWANLGSTSQGAIGTTQLNATASINFNGTTYNGYTQDYSSASGSHLIFNNGSPTTLISGGGSITFTTGTILLSNDLSISSSGGAVAMTDLLTTAPNLINFTLQASTGTFTFTQIGSPTDYLNTVTLTAGIFYPVPIFAPNPGTNVYALSGSFTVLIPLYLSGSICLTAPTIYGQPIILDGDVTITCTGTCSGSSGGTITFYEPVNAASTGGSLTIDFCPSCSPSCTGSVIFNAPVGTTTPYPTSLNIDSAIDVTAANYSITVGTLSITNGSGTTTINRLSTSGSGGAAIASPIVNLQGSITSGGQLTADIGSSTSSALNIAAGTTINITGPFQQTGSGAVAIGGSVTTQNEPIEFNGPVSLVGDTTLQSNGTTNGGISFASPNATINGEFNLIIDAGSSNINFNEAVGLPTEPLASLQINSAGSVTASASIFAGSITQSAGSGSFDALTASGSNGIQLSGSAFTLNGNINTGGPLSITNSALLRFANASSTYIATALTQTGAGSIHMAGTFSPVGAVSLSSGVELIGATSFDTHTTNQNISFTSALTDNGSHNNLTLNTGTGNITFSNLGTSPVPIGALTITHAGTVQAGSIYAASITTTNPFTAAAIFGSMTMNGGITLSGTGFTIGAITTGSSSSCSITNSGPLSLTLGASSSVAGPFEQPAQQRKEQLRPWMAMLTSMAALFCLASEVADYRTHRQPHPYLTSCRDCSRGRHRVRNSLVCHFRLLAMRLASRSNHKFHTCAETTQARVSLVSWGWSRILLFDHRNLWGCQTAAPSPMGLVSVVTVTDPHRIAMGFSPQLGDGRALLLGELIDRNGQRRDLALKGSGRTPFSRGGDGKAALGPVLREYLLGEAMHALGIPTTRALAVVRTGESIDRDTVRLPGAVLARIAASHIRVGTFQYFAARGELNRVRRLADYVIARHYPEVQGQPDQYLLLLRTMGERQAALIARWMGVGFIHGVMNTDNMTLSGETIDYGPCAFMDAYDPGTVFSSIDTHGRYAYANQPIIARWNLARLAETLLPLLHDHPNDALTLATEAITHFRRVTSIIGWQKCAEN